MQRDDIRWYLNNPKREETLGKCNGAMKQQHFYFISMKVPLETGI